MDHTDTYGDIIARGLFYEYILLLLFLKMASFRIMLALTVVVPTEVSVVIE